MRVVEDPAFEERWNKAIDILLNTGLVAPFIDAFWAFCDGEITEGEYREKVGP